MRKKPNIIILKKKSVFCNPFSYSQSGNRYSTDEEIVTDLDGIEIKMIRFYFSEAVPKHYMLPGKDIVQGLMPTPAPCDKTFAI